MNEDREELAEKENLSHNDRLHLVVLKNIEDTIAEPSYAGESLDYVRTQMVFDATGSQLPPGNRLTKPGDELRTAQDHMMITVTSDDYVDAGYKYCLWPSSRRIDYIVHKLNVLPRESFSFGKPVRRYLDLLYRWIGYFTGHHLTDDERVLIHELSTELNLEPGVTPMSYIWQTYIIDFVHLDPSILVSEEAKSLYSVMDNFPLFMTELRKLLLTRNNHSERRAFDRPTISSDEDVMKDLVIIMFSLGIIGDRLTNDVLDRVIRPEGRESLLEKSVKPDNITLSVVNKKKLVIPENIQVDEDLSCGLIQLDLTHDDSGIKVSNRKGKDEIVVDPYGFAVVKGQPPQIIIAEITRRLLSAYPQFKVLKDYDHARIELRLYHFGVPDTHDGWSLEQHTQFVSADTCSRMTHKSQIYHYGNTKIKSRTFLLWEQANNWTRGSDFYRYVLPTDLIHGMYYTGNKTVSEIGAWVGDCMFVDDNDLSVVDRNLIGYALSNIAIDGIAAKLSFDFSGKHDLSGLVNPTALWNVSNTQLDQIVINIGETVLPLLSDVLLGRSVNFVVPLHQRAKIHGKMGPRTKGYCNVSNDIHTYWLDAHQIYSEIQESSTNTVQRTKIKANFIKAARHLKLMHEIGEDTFASSWNKFKAEYLTFATPEEEVECLSLLLSSTAYNFYEMWADYDLIQRKRWLDRKTADAADAESSIFPLLSQTLSNHFKLHNDYRYTCLSTQCIIPYTLSDLTHLKRELEMWFVNETMPAGATAIFTDLFTDKLHTLKNDTHLLRTFVTMLSELSDDDQDYSRTAGLCVGTIRSWLHVLNVKFMTSRSSLYHGVRLPIPCWWINSTHVDLPYQYRELLPLLKAEIFPLEQMEIVARRLVSECDGDVDAFDEALNSRLYFHTYYSLLGILDDICPNSMYYFGYGLVEALIWDVVNLDSSDEISPWIEQNVDITVFKLGRKDKRRRNKLSRLTPNQRHVWTHEFDVSLGESRQGKLEIWYTSLPPAEIERLYGSKPDICFTINTDLIAFSPFGPGHVELHRSGHVELLRSLMREWHTLYQGKGRSS